MKFLALYTPSIPASTSLFTLIKTRPVSVFPNKKTLTSYSYRTCGKSFAFRNLLFSYLYKYGYYYTNKLTGKTSNS